MKDEFSVENLSAKSWHDDAQNLIRSRLWARRSGTDPHRNGHLTALKRHYPPFIHFRLTLGPGESTMSLIAWSGYFVRLHEPDGRHWRIRPTPNQTQMIYDGRSYGPLFLA